MSGQEPFFDLISSRDVGQSTQSSAASASEESGRAIVAPVAPVTVVQASSQAGTAESEMEVVQSDDAQLAHGKQADAKGKELEGATPRPSEELGTLGASEEAENIFQKPQASDNVITKAVWKQLMICYEAEKASWTKEMLQEVVETAPKIPIKIGKTNCDPLHYPLFRKVKEIGRATWTQFFILRVIYGADRCARQDWFPELAKAYPQALQPAPIKVIPENYREVLDNKLTCAAPQREVLLPVTPTPESRGNKRGRSKELTEAEAGPSSNAGASRSRRSSKETAGSKRSKPDSFTDDDWNDFENSILQAPVIVDKDALATMNDRMRKYDDFLCKQNMIIKELKMDRQQIKQEHTFLKNQVTEQHRQIETLANRINILKRKMEELGGH